MANAIWQATITDQSGNILPGAEITVVNETTGLNAALFSTRTGTAKSNPFFADANGFAQFYAAPGLYRITATSGGTGTTQTWRYVRLVDVATNDEALAGTAGVLPDAAGVHAAFNQYGLGELRDGSAFGKDFNLFTTPGFYQLASGAAEEFSNAPAGASISRAHLLVFGNMAPYGAQVFFDRFNNNSYFRNCNASFLPWLEILNSGNTTVDPNGFIKAASPIASLYNDRAESNGSIELEAMQFERIGTGHYRLTGVPELSRDGWYIETPKDRNSNVYFTLDYVESPGTLDIYTYTPDYSTGRVENGVPVDILDGRFVSLRFAESEPEPEESAE